MSHCPCGCSTPCSHGEKGISPLHASDIMLCLPHNVLAAWCAYMTVQICTGLTYPATAAPGVCYHCTSSSFPRAMAAVEGWGAEACRPWAAAHQRCSHRSPHRPGGSLSCQGHQQLSMLACSGCMAGVSGAELLVLSRGKRRLGHDEEVWLCLWA